MEIPTNSNIEDPKKKKSGKDEDLKKSLELFDEADDFDIKTECVHEVKIPKDTTSKILKISRMVDVAVLTISGYEEQPKGKGESSVYKLVKQPLASSAVIKTFQTLLKPYADESNMVTKKDWESFKTQARSDWEAFYKFCLREKASPEECERAVYRTFQGCLINVGEITADNPGNMKSLFSGINDHIEQETERNPFK